MLWNYLKVAVRAFLKHKGYTIINLFGLSIGVCCCIMIMFYVKGEFSYDGFHSKADRLYRAWTTEKDQGEDAYRVSTITCLPLGPALQKNVNQVEYACRVYKTTLLVSYGGHSFNEPVHLVDSPFFKLFDFKLKEGNMQQPWPDPNSVIISESIAKKYFSDRPAVGNSLEVQFGDSKILLKVSGVVRNNAPESSIVLDFLIPYSNDHLLFNERMRMSAWSNIFTETYVLLKKGVTASSADKGIANMTKNILGADYAGGTYGVHLQPIRAIHLDNHLPRGIEDVGNPQYDYVIATTGGLILLIACINFIILSIGYSTSRSLEVCVRKVLGAEKRQLIRQFWGEAVIITLVSVIVGIALAFILLNPFGALIGKDLNWRFDLIFWAFSLVVIVIISFLTGIYPAFILSRFNPIEVLKGKLKGKVDVGILRKYLVVGQFVVCITMIICTMVIGQQLRFIKDKNVGFDRENIVIIRTNQKPADGMKLANLFKNAAVKLSDVASASSVMYGLNEAPWAEIGFKDRNAEIKTFQFNSVDVDFLKTEHIKLVAGNNYLSNADSSVLVNEAFVREYGLGDAVGKDLPGFSGIRIRGVMQDINVESLHTTVKPLVLATDFDPIGNKAETMLIHFAMKPKIVVHLHPGNIHGQIDGLRNVWRDIAPGQEFDFSFLDEAIANQYKQDERTGAIIDWVAAWSIFISCMGLFGLVTLSMSSRVKEIAIRKVLGASVGRIIMVVSNEFLLLVSIAALISIPLAWIAMKYWLSDFAYRIILSWWVFFLAIVLTLLIAFITICTQAARAALANPIQGIRSE